MDLKLLPNHQKHKASNNLIIKITTPINEENFDLNIAAFLYAKADGNYLEIFYSHSTDKEKELKRLTLKEFDDQLNICHFYCGDKLETIMLHKEKYIGEIKY